ncbi:TetR/AcrR family transcriptional regulator [Microlunatus parietis]|uniref:AcrR family transcriptional regulator n=1 Tax=Microlunatus parietis TaxID=682979 RepID=A0A7Y9ICA1_9ACTN|nr:helix-turn-helix domain-containing protein [Microlunatus parietis]NYE74214.1 AcrR family transcriptional regulator [Microlunatus parietis]
MERSRRSRGERAGLSREQIVAAARRTLATRGLAGLSLRAVAAELGVAPNAIYSHLDDKNALLDAVLDDVLTAVRNPSAKNPRRALRTIMVDTYDTLVEHPSLVGAYLTRQGSRGPEAQRLGVIMDDCLDRLGAGGRAGEAGRRTMIVYTIGYAAFATGWTADGEQPLSASRVRRDFLAGLDWLINGIVGPP